MEKAKDGVTLIADAIRREMAEEEEKKKATTNNNPTNVIDVTAQFSTPEPKKQETPPPEPKKEELPNDGNSNNGNDDGTVYKNE